MEGSIYEIRKAGERDTVSALFDNCLSAWACLSKSAVGSGSVGPIPVLRCASGSVDIVHTDTIEDLYGTENGCRKAYKAVEGVSKNNTGAAAVEALGC